MTTQNPRDEAMKEVSGTEPQSTVVSGKSKLRYPLRSATKSQVDKPPISELSNSSSSSNKGKFNSIVSQSVSNLDVSGKDRSVKPTRRQSIPSISRISLPTPHGFATPVSDARTKRAPNGHPISETPMSDISKSGRQRKFSALSSPSYWLSQVKLSESSAKHTISLAFFKLAMEAGCQPKLLREELKSYVRRHQLKDVDGAKELFEKYSISCEAEPEQSSETCPQPPEEGSSSPAHASQSVSSAAGARGLKPRSLNSKVDTADKAAAPANNSAPDSDVKGARKGSVNKKNGSSKPVNGGRGICKKTQSSDKNEMAKTEKVKQGNKGTKSTPLDTTEDEGNKENVDTSQAEGISVAGAV